MARATQVNQKIRHSAANQLPMPMRKARHGKRYLYDTNHGDGQSEASDMSVADVEGLSGFVMASCEDDLSQITDKMHNLTLDVGHRKYPRHHKSYHHQRQFHSLSRCQEEATEEPHWYTDNNRSPRYPDEEALNNTLSEDAAVALQFSSKNTSHNRPSRHNDDDFEIPTNISETRSTATTSSIENKRLTVMGDIDSVNLPSFSSCWGSDTAFSIDITQSDKTCRSLFTGCLPSWGALSRCIFLLGCAWTLGLAVEQLSVAKKHTLASSGGRRSRKLEDTPLIRGSSSLPALALLKLSNVDPNAALSELGFAANGTMSQGQDPNGILSESFPWDSLTLEQEEVALEMGFMKPTDSSSSSRQDLLMEAEAEPETETTRLLPALDLSSAENRPNSTVTSNIFSPPNDIIVPSDEAISINNTMGQISSQEMNINIIVFRVDGGYPVTKMMVLAFAASLCFTTVGIIEWMQHDFLFQLALIIGGVLGLLSAMVQECSPLASQVLHILSVHSFLASAAAILGLRCRLPLPSTPTNRAHQSWIRGRTIYKTKEEALMLADFVFATGAAIEVVASYASFGFGTALPPLEIFRVEVFSASLWVASALIYLCCSYKQT